MLKAMSAMVDNFDTQMVDYVADIDMQVQGFSSDPWLHDEVKMEEDAPGLKPENFAQDVHDQGDLTIEIDMEDHNSAEYDMVDDEQLHHPPEILDIEVYDASQAHSPAMGVLDSALPAESTFSSVVIPPTQPQETDVTTLTVESIATSVAPPALTPVSEETVVAPVPDLPRYASHTDEESNTVSIRQSLTHDTAEPLEDASSAEPVPPFDPEYPSSTNAAGAELVEGRLQDEVSPLPDLQSHVVEGINSAFVAPDEGLPPESLETSGPHVESTTSDPLEISEGVYIDPPPAVLLTISSDDHEHEFCLFNEPPEWPLPSGEHKPDARRTLLHHLPTMYYESLFSLFEVLRQDEFIQSSFQLLEVELVLQAVDLALTISEDNVYSREVSLHDLNILHDGSGIGGPLKTKLYASTPRFIMQYQQLQEHVSRLQLGHQSRGVLGAHTENDQGAPTEEPQPETESLSNQEENKESEELVETETHLPPQLFQPDVVADLHEEDEHEDENGVSQPAESGEDRNARGYEGESPTDGYPTVEDNDRDSVSAQTQEEAAVVSLDVLEAEVVDTQLAEDELGDEVSAPLLDGSEEGDETEPENEPELGDVHDTRQAGISQVADGQDEVDQELEQEADAQGDEFPHEHSEYVEPDAESEPLPDRFQALPQDVDDHDEYEANTTTIDHTTLLNEGDEYNEEEPLPELPTDPISFDDENWGQELEVFENADESWNGGDENETSVSNHSSVTLSSRGSKRNYDEYESGGEGYEEEEDQQWELPGGSPDPKRTRTQ